MYDYYAALSASDCLSSVPVSFSATRVSTASSMIDSATTSTVPLLDMGDTGERSQSGDSGLGSAIAGGLVGVLIVAVYVLLGVVIVVVWWRRRKKKVLERKSEILNAKQFDDSNLESKSEQCENFVEYSYISETNQDKSVPTHSNPSYQPMEHDQSDGLPMSSNPAYKPVQQENPTEYSYVSVASQDKSVPTHSNPAYQPLQSDDIPSSSNAAYQPLQSDDIPSSSNPAYQPVEHNQTDSAVAQENIYY